MTFLAAHAGGHPSGCPHRAGLILSKKEKKTLAQLQSRTRGPAFLNTDILLNVYSEQIAFPSEAFPSKSQLRAVAIARF